MKTSIRIIIPLVVVCFAFAPRAQAVCQEGCLTNENTVFGDDALLNNTGEGSTAVGFQALMNNTTGGFNTATGQKALSNNTGGNVNTATGAEALIANTTGSFNTATGTSSMFRNTTGGFNTATGAAALEGNTTGNNNTAEGYHALSSNSTGTDNTASGTYALDDNTTGNNNSAFGSFALQLSTVGNDNTAVGHWALLKANGFSNIALGESAGINLTRGSGNIYIGNPGGASREVGQIRIGRTGTQEATFIAGISGVSVPSGVGVVVGTDGQLGTVVSSQRFKDEIKPLNKKSEAILSLKPVAFRYKKELDPESIPQFGLVAEDVAKVDPDLVAKDEQGKPYTVRYEAVNAMLLNEFLKEHKRAEEQAKKVEAQATKIEQLENRLQQMAARLEAKGL